MKARTPILIALAILVVTGAFALVRQEEKESNLELEPNTFPETMVAPLGLPPIPWPADNPYTREKAYLGKLLYFDKRLSSDGTVACASCHTLNDAFADQHATSIGIEGFVGSRNSPTVINTAYLKLLFWDGRVSSLEEQCKAPIANPHEMSLLDNEHASHMACEQRIQSIPGYRKLFKDAFGDEEVSIDEVTQAIATFERTVLSGNSPYDRYMAGDKTALTAEQIHGIKVFKDAACINCHNGPSFSNGKFTNIGVGMDQEKPDLGRYAITKDKKDWGSFKVPILREVENTYPYMHDGKYWTLEEVVDYYDEGGIANQNLHPLMKPLHLSDDDKRALVGFLKSLSGEGSQHFTPPDKFPE
ncbi:MAG: c-type cytochrome [Parachlamydiaceae bacterium]|nr:c-type cytochrome [Parachlamydiaceae bacterium]